MNLSSASRDRIVDAVLADRGFPSRIKSAEDALKEAVIREYEKTYPTNTVAMNTLMEWGDTSSFVSLLNDQGHCIDSFHHCRAMFDRKSQSPRVTQTPEIASMIDALAVLKKDAQEVAELVRAVVNSCRTVKQLLDTAPELGRFVPEFPGSSTALVDMATVNKVRAMLGGAT